MGSLTLRKRVFFSLVPLCVLLVLTEVAVRVTGLADPSLNTGPLPEETLGLIRPDPDLFWSHLPGSSIRQGSVTVTTNGLGLRAPEIGPKSESEYRILSLGESTTFGIGVENHQTYTERLGALLQVSMPDRAILAINGGVSAYSSFQSLKYLELRGLELKPDLVLFYHEVNDYLPSSLRNSGNSEIGVIKTDKQLYRSRMHRIHRDLLERSALFRWLNNAYAYRKIQQFNRVDFRNPLLDVGLPDLIISPRLAKAGGELTPQTEFNEMSLGRRVSEAEREENLEDLVALCKREKIELVVIHPAYQASRRHECLLTRFCRKHGVRMFEAFDHLHPTGEEALFIDDFHPSREGHERLAAGLVALVLETVPVKNKAPR